MTAMVAKRTIYCCEFKAKLGRQCGKRDRTETTLHGQQWAAYQGQWVLEFSIVR